MSATEYSKFFCLRSSPVESSSKRSASVLRSSSFDISSEILSRYSAARCAGVFAANATGVFSAARLCGGLLQLVDYGPIGRIRIGDAIKHHGVEMIFAARRLIFGPRIGGLDLV